MYCVIQEIENKKQNSHGEYKEIEVYKYSWSEKYSYGYSGGRFERLIKKAYRISIHKSYRKDGQVKKKQWVICTIDYYNLATGNTWVGDHIVSSKLQEKLKDMGIDEDELWKLVYAKLDPLIDKIKKEYQETEEYKVHKKHGEIIDKYLKDKYEFEGIYGKNTYDCCYDVFGSLRNKEMLDNIIKQYEASKEYQRSYYENFESNYNKDDFNSYFNKNSSNYNDNEKESLKKFYKVLAKKFHPDIVKDNGEMMKLVNKLKGDWGL